jgi:membrane protease YdiL (CAAX protease family)
MRTKHTETTLVAIFAGLTMVLSFAVYRLPLPREALPFLLVLLPALFALILTGLHDGGAGVYTLLGKLGQWRIRPRWLAFALFLAVEMRLLMSVVAWLLGLIPTLQVRPASPGQLLLLALILLIAALLEELGWRGYALPKLLTRCSPLAASLVIGVVWGVLHLVLHLPGMMYEGTPPLATLLQLIALSVILTWFYLQSGGTIMLTTLFHAAQSFFVIINEGIALEVQMWLMAVIYLAVAALIVVGAAWKLAYRDGAKRTTDAPLPATVDNRLRRLR